MNLKNYILIQLMEECAEVQHACAKALRFGLSDSPNILTPTNKEHLADELLDLLAIIQVVKTQKIAILPESKEETEQIINYKLDKIEKWMKYSVEKGILNDN